MEEGETVLHVAARRVDETKAREFLQQGTLSPPFTGWKRPNPTP